MRIPNDTLHITTARTYGAIPGLEFETIEQMQGCPARYRKYVHEGQREQRPAGPDPLAYGRTIHKALYLAEAEDVPLLPDALARSWETSLPPEMYAEAEQDLRAFLEKGGIAGGLTCLHVEKRLDMPLMEWNGKPYRFGGIVDWIGVDPSDENTLYICDYKTNRSPTSRADLEKDVQMTGYAKLAVENIGTIAPGMDVQRVVVMMEQLKFETLFAEKTEEDLETFTAWASAVANRILEDKKGHPKLNRWCGHCPDRWECPEWIKLPGEGATLMDRLAGASTLEDRVKLIHQVAAIRNKLDQMVDSVREELIQSPGEYDGMAYELAEKWETDTDLIQLHAALGPRFYDYVKVRAMDLKQYVKANPEEAGKIEACQRSIVNGVRLAKHKIK